VPKEATVVIVDPHSIFRLGMATCLESLALIGDVAGVDTIGEALQRPELAAADLLIVDAAAAGLHTFVHHMRAAHATPTLVSGVGWASSEIVAIVEAGAVGVLAKESLTPATLEANVHAALHGAGVVPSELLASVMATAEDDPAGEAGTITSVLSPREQEVLRLIADGHATREVATELSYSERTIKNILHDVVTKLGARTRSQAVAHAVRSGLI
jgi:DNA-binding NarL/FixJ family response regulator